MYSWIRYTLVWTVAIGSMIACKTSGKNEVLRIAAATNMQSSIQEIATAFEVEYGIQTQILIASSGKHTAQILAGAPYDIFISADMEYPSEIATRLQIASPVVICHGTLAIWSRRQLKSLDLVQDLKNEHMRIAIANPKYAPYGRAAQGYLERAGVWDQVQEGLILGESVSQINHFIETEVVDVAITAQASRYEGNLRSKLHWVNLTHDQRFLLPHGMIVLSQSEAAKGFARYVRSSDAQSIWRRYEYLTDLGMGTCTD